MTYQDIIKKHNELFENKVVRFVNNEMTTNYYFLDGNYVDQFDLQEYFEDYKNENVENIAYALQELGTV